LDSDVSGSSDLPPGKTKGEDIEQFGDGWYLVNAGGKSLEPDTSESNSGSDNSGSNSGGGGY